ncbi:FecR family protein [Echinicola shivajiensis]|uniref:FecR family protein n=1 Tax=Echinicola shivajiensis TaxID=1035916 RepID=UPI001BFC89EE|nr:FecR family protein [Echinicola shivajiensis]
MRQLTEILSNPEFVRWVKQPDPELDLYWSNWMKANPTQVEDLKMAREIVLGINFEKKSADPAIKDEVLQHVLSAESTSAVASGTFGSGSEGSGISIWFKSQQGYRVAAIIFLVLTFSFIFSWFIPQEEADLPVIAMVEKVTKKGERLNFRLPDGSMVWLNSDSKLSYPAQFTNEERALSLKGEAFFEVEHNPEKPFRVTSSNLVTTALGTSFNINNYHEDVKVALLTGKVEVENLDDKSKDLLVPGELLSYSNDTQSTIIEGFDKVNVMDWKEGVLAFNQSDFDEVIESLESWYAVDFEVEGRPARKWDISINFDNASLEQVLLRISYIEKFEYEIKGKSITIKF